MCACAVRERLCFLCACKGGGVHRELGVVFCVCVCTCRKDEDFQFVCMHGAWKRVCKVRGLI